MGWGILVVVGIVVLVAVGLRQNRHLDEEKLAVLRSLEGREVRLVLSYGGQISLPHTWIGRVVVREDKATLLREGRRRERAQ